MGQREIATGTETRTAADASERRPRRSAAGAAVLVFLATASFQAPNLDRPFGPHEQISGCYFGPFAVSFADYGFEALRGASVYKTRYQPLPTSIVYANHPPAVAWPSLLFGSDERGVRSPFVLAASLAAALFCLLLAPAVGTWPAAAAALIYGLSPGTAFDGIAAHDTVVGAAGLLLLWCFRNGRREGFGALCFRAAAVLVAFVGVWLDWSFAWWLAASAFVAPRGSIRIFVRSLAPLAISAVASLGLLFLWRDWAHDAPVFGGTRPLSAADAANFALLTSRPSLPVLFREVWCRLVEGYTAPTLVLGALGLVSWARRGRGLAAALFVPPLLNVAVFASHATLHVQFVVWFGFTAAAGAAALAADVAGFMKGRGGRVAAAVLLGAATLWAGWSSVRVWEGRASPIFQELGRVIDAEAADMSEGMPPSRIWGIGFNLPYAFAYYIQAPLIYSGVETEAQLDMLIGVLPEGFGCRLLVLEGEEEGAGIQGGAMKLGISDGLRRRLKAYESRELPSLKMRVPTDRFGRRGFVIRDAHVYEVRAAVSVDRRPR